MKFAIFALSATLLMPTVVNAAYYSCDAYDNGPASFPSVYGYQAPYQGGYQGGYGQQRGGYSQAYRNAPQEYNQSYNQGYNQGYNQPYNQGYNQQPYNQGGQPSQYANQNQPSNLASAKDGYKTPDDLMLLRKIRQAISRNTDIHPQLVSLFVYDQDVKLNGQVGTADESKKIEDIIVKIEGVKGVENNLDFPQNTKSNSRFSANTSGNNPDQQNPNQQNPSSPGWFGSNTADKNAANNDQVLLEQVQYTIERDPDAKKFNNVEFVVKDRVIILKGSVDTEKAHQLLKNKLQQVQGIKDVQDQITVRNDSPELSYNDQPAANVKVGDSALKAHIEDKLKGGFFSKNYTQVEISVKDGTVTLKGSVENNEDIKELMDRIQGIEGVKTIDNQVVVRKINK